MYIFRIYLKKPNIYFMKMVEFFLDAFGGFTLSVRSMSMIWSNSGVLSMSLWISRVSMALHAAG